MINGVTQIIMTKADVLDTFNELSVCEAYEINGKQSSIVPYQMLKAEIKPILKNFDGWKTDISGIKEYSQLPEKMKSYIQHINQYLGVSVKFVSNGPGREQIIIA